MNKITKIVLGFLALILVLGIIGSNSENPQNKGSEKTKVLIPAQTEEQKEIAKAPQSTPVTDNREIKISYSTRTSNKIGSYSEAPAGKTFLIITMTIENNGYKELNTNPNYFVLLINNIKYTYDSTTYSLEDKLDSVDIMDGGKLTGSVAFAVPTGTTEFQLKYDMEYKDYNIKYQQI